MNTYKWRKWLGCFVLLPIFFACHRMVAESNNRQDGRPQHTNRVTRASFSPDGKTILTAGVDGRIILWDVLTGQPILSVEHSPDGAASVAFSPDGRSFATAGGDRLAMIWDVQSGTLLQTLHHGNKVTDVAFSPDGRSLLTSSGDFESRDDHYRDLTDWTVRLWDVQNGRLIRIFEGTWRIIDHVAFSPNGRRVLASSGDFVMTWETQSGRPLLTIPGSSVAGAFFSPDGRRILIARGNSIDVHDVDNGEYLHSIGGISPVVDGAVSPDGGVFLLAYTDRTASVWNARTGAHLHTISGYPDMVALCHMGGLLKRVPFSPFTGHMQSVSSVRFSPDGRTIVTTSSDHTAKLWRAGDGQLLQTLGSPVASCHSLLSSCSWALSPFGR